MTEPVARATPPALAAWHQAVAHRDPARLPQLLADDVVFHSPVVYAPQLGPDLTALYLAAALQVLGNDSFRYTREVVGERDAVLEFVTTVDGVDVNGVDMITWDDNDRITDFKVMLRPWRAIELVRGRMAAMLAALG